MPRSIFPIYLYTDGDIVLAFSNGKKEFTDGEVASSAIRTGDERIYEINETISAAADCTARAVVHAMLKAESVSR